MSPLTQALHIYNHLRVSFILSSPSHFLYRAAPLSLWLWPSGQVHHRSTSPSLPLHSFWSNTSGEHRDSTRQTRPPDAGALPRTDPVAAPLLHAVDPAVDVPPHLEPATPTPMHVDPMVAVPPYAEILRRHPSLTRIPRWQPSSTRILLRRYRWILKRRRGSGEQRLLSMDGLSGSIDGLSRLIQFLYLINRGG